MGNRLKVVEVGEMEQWDGGSWVGRMGNGIEVVYQG